MADDTGKAGTQTGACPFTKIPIEVLLRISSNLSTPDLGSLRLTCRGIEQTLFSTFAQEFFSRKQFMISEFSLEALVAISKSRLGIHIERLQFGLDRLEGLGYLSAQDPPQPAVVAQYLNAQELLQSQIILWSSGRYRDLLTEAFENLSQLQEVVIRDFNSPTRHRDGEDAPWKSYGMRTAMNQSFVRFSTRPTSLVSELDHYPSKVFGTVVYALGKAAARPKSIEVIARRDPGAMRDQAFGFPRSLEPSIKEMLLGLEKLHIAVAFPTGPLNTTVRTSGHQLARFLSHTPNLKNLRLNHAKNGSSEEWAGFLGDLVDPTKPPSLPLLEELSLGEMYVEGRLLVQLIEKFAKTLRSLELWRICLLWFLEEDELEPNWGERSNWEEVFGKLLETKDLELHHIKISLPQVAYGQKSLQSTSTRMQRPWHCNFPGEGEESKTRTYTGIDWRHFMQETMKHPLKVTGVHSNFGYEVHPAWEDVDAEGSDEELEEDELEEEEAIALMNHFLEPVDGMEVDEEVLNELMMEEFGLQG